MIAVDTNILVYAHREDSAFHAQADAALTRLAEGKNDWAIPWPCIHEFLAIATHPGIYKPPTPLFDAIVQVECWMESPSLRLIGEDAPDAHWRTLRDLLVKGKAVGPAIHDARVAAICISHDVEELWTADRDFSRFKGLKTANPLA